MAVLTAVYTVTTILIFFANRSANKVLSDQLKIQQDQLVKDEFIKLESKILIEFREALYAAEKSIIYFFPSLMKIHKITSEDSSIIKKPEDITIDTYLYHYDKVHTIAKLYYKNYNILIKYNLYEESKYIWAILETFVSLSGKDFTFTEIERTSKTKTFTMSEYNKIADSFSVSIYAEECKDKYEDEKIFIDGIYDAHKNIDKYISEMQSSIMNLLRKLDALTTYNCNDIQKSYSRKHFPTSEQVKSILCNKEQAKDKQ